MKKLILAAVLAAAVGLAAISVQAAADKPAAMHSSAAAQSDVLYQCPMHPEVISDKPGKCPKCGMQLVARTKEEVMAAAHKAAGVGTSAHGTTGAPHAMGPMPPALLRQRMMVDAKIDNADPAALLAMSATLKLTKEQSAKLEAIAADARKKSLAVLTKEQKAELDKVPSKPASVMELMRQAMAAREAQSKLPAGHPALPAGHPSMPAGHPAMPAQP